MVISWCRGRRSCPSPMSGAGPRISTQDRRFPAPVSELFERGPAEEELLLAAVGEAHRGLGLVARARQLEDHPVAEGAVAHVVAHLQALALGGARLGPARPQGGVDHPLAMGSAAGL